MAAPSLLPNYAFGVQGRLRDGAHFVDEATVLYTAGQCVVWWNIEHKTQRIVTGSAETDSITAVTLSPSKKLVAVAERAIVNARRISGDGKNAGVDHTKDGEIGKPDVKGPVISIYDAISLKKKKVLLGGDIGSREYVSLAFSFDGKIMAAQGGAPDWNLVLWSLEKSKLIASVKTSHQSLEVYQVQCCPVDSALLTVIGDGFAKTFRATDSNLRPVSTGVGKIEDKKFLCHMWLSEPGEHNSDKEKDRIDDKGGICIYSLETGELLWVEGGEVVSSITPGGLPGTGVVEVLVQFSKGILCAEVGAIISIYEKMDEESFKRTHSFKVDNTGTRVCSLAMSPGEDLLVCMMQSSQIIVVPFQNLDLFKPDEVPKELNVQAYHSECITGLDVCMRKPIVVTCSTDKSVRVWNYVEKCCELAKFFPEQALSIALHPSGLHLLVGFVDKLRLMNILIDDIRMYKEFNVKACQECAFSNGGQYFAAVQSNAVHIFSTYTCENIGNLRAHNGKVRSIWWSPDDTAIVTAGVDGAVYEWRVSEFKRTRENVIKGCAYTDVIGLKDSKNFFGVGSDRKLKELDEASVIKELFTGALLTKIALPPGSRLLFSGTELGSLRAYRYPLTGILIAGEFYEIHATSAPITRVCVSVDSTLLLCTSEDGVLLIFDIRDKEKAIASSLARHEKDALGWAHEVLVYKNDLDELRTRVQELEQQVTEVKDHCNYELKVKDQHNIEQMKELTDNLARKLEESRLKYEAVIQQRNDKILECCMTLQSVHMHISVLYGVALTWTSIPI